MQFPAGLVEGRFKTRLNRFLAIVEVQGREVGVHVANSGRMREILVPGYRVLISPKPGGHRKTGVRPGPGGLGYGPGLGRCPAAQRTGRRSIFPKGVSHSFVTTLKCKRKSSSAKAAWTSDCRAPQVSVTVEAKSVTLVVDGVGLFPDAPTTRGAKHVRSLAQAVKEGHRAAVVFVVQRDDAHALRPHDEADPDFGAALRESVAAGVEALAYGCRVTETGITLDRRLPVEL